MSRMNGNGNGKLPAELSRRTHQVDQEPTAADLMELPPWLKQLRDSMASAIQGEDLKEILKVQIEKAKTGDVAAAGFVMNQAHRLMAAEQKRVSIVQNNYYDVPEERRPDTPDRMEPRPPVRANGSELEPAPESRIRKLQARASARMPLTDERDRLRAPVSDDEEKELRRRQDEEEAA